MNTPNRWKQLIEGLALSAIVIVTIAGALLLSGRETVAQPIGTPSPIGSTLPSASATPTPTPTRTAIDLTPTIIQSVTATSTATPSPTATATATMCPPPIGWQPYTVGPFDTLFSIAAQFSVTPQALAQANCLAGTAISAGQTIYVPSTVPTAIPAPCYPPYGWVIYIVRPGDTLSALAIRYNISIAQLQQANCLSTTFLYVGQILRVPPILIYPTFTPTFMPTLIPSETPTSMPTATPSDTPTLEPTIAPTLTPESTITPTLGPTIEPTLEPTSVPTISTATPAPTIKPPSPTPIDTPTSVPSPLNTPTQ